MKTKLVYSENGKSVHIQFANGKESFEFESKEEAIFAIKQCLQRKKITQEEEGDLIKGIILSDLPNNHEKFFLLPLALMLLLSGMEVKQKEQEPIVNPYVEICKCGFKLTHAHIFNEKGEPVSPPFMTKSEGLNFVEYLLSREHISEEDSIHLNVLIDLLPLIVEDATLN